jgi:phosphoserine/homoserine phosphotransferase
MRYRIAILDRHGIGTFRHSKRHPHFETAAGAKNFLDELRTLTQVIILSDTFEQFAAPLIEAIELADLVLPQAGGRK